MEEKYLLPEEEKEEKFCQLKKVAQVTFFSDSCKNEKNSIIKKK